MTILRILCLLLLLAVAPNATASPAPVPASSIVAVHTHHVAVGLPPEPDRTIAQLDALASQLAGQPVTITCLPDAVIAVSDPGADGYVNWQTNADGSYTLIPVIYLRRQLCVDVESLGIRAGNPARQRYPAVVNLYSDTGPVIDIEDGRALAALAHEAMHIRLGSRDEALVECANEQNRWAALAPLGLPQWLAMRVYWGMRWHHEALPAPYQNDC